MSYADRLQLALHLGLYAIAIFLVLKAFGPAKRYPVAWHLEKSNLVMLESTDAEFVIKKQRAMTKKEFIAFVNRFPPYFEEVRENVA